MFKGYGSFRDSEEFYKTEIKFGRNSMPPNWTYHIPAYVKERSKDKKTAYVIGTGPSLKDIDMSKLKDEVTITFNRAYVAFNDWGFDPTYYLAIDSQDMLSISEDIKSLIDKSNIEHFFLPRENLNYFNNKREKITFLQDIPDVWSLLYSFGSFVSMKEKDYNMMITQVMPNAGFMGLKMLYLMGYQEVALLGCDARYRMDPVSQKDITWDDDGCVSAEDSDVNHFRNDYFGKGQRFGRPVSEDHLRTQWMSAKKDLAYMNPTLEKTKKDNGESTEPWQEFKIYSCSQGSSLNDIYPYIPFDRFVEGDRSV